MSFVAISTVKYPNSIKQDIHTLGSKMIPLAKQQPGFIAVAFHQSCESNETMMYWEWESRSHHEACMASPDWLAIMEQSKSLFETEGVEFALKTYERIL